MKTKVMALLALIFVVIGLVGAPASAGPGITKGAEGNSGPTYNPSPKLSNGKDDSAKRNESLVGSSVNKTAPRTDPGNVAKKAMPKGVQKNGVQLFATSCSGQPDGTCHSYAGVYQDIVNGTTPITGMGMRQEVDDPTVRPWDASVNGFSLMQNAVQDTVNGMAVEAGWVVQGPFSDDKPRFFVSAFNSGNHVGWGTGFVPVSTPLMAHGTDLTAMIGDGVGFRLFWTYFDTTGCSGCEGWWLSYAKAVGDPLTYIGHYPMSVFGGLGTFEGSDVDLVQGFQENASSQLPSQTHMGTGSILTRLGSSAFGLSGASAPTEDWTVGATGFGVTDPSKWLATKISATAWSGGGPGGFEDIVSTVSPANDCSGEGTGTNPSGLGALCTYSTNTPPVPSSAIVTQIDMSAGTACRGNVGTSAGYAPIRNVALTGIKQVTFWPTANCTGTPQTANHGRITLDAAHSNQANLSYKVLATLATCATGWPTTAPTC